MPKTMSYNPFVRVPEKSSKPQAQTQNDIAHLDEWMIGNPMLETRNYSVHLRHEVADRLDGVLGDLTHRFSEDNQVEINASRIIELAVSYLLDNYARAGEKSNLLSRLRSDKTGGTATSADFKAATKIG